MKQLFSSPDSAEVGLLKGMLDIAGIPCEIRNDAVSQVLVGAAFYSELWVLNDDDYARAREVIADRDRTASAEEPEKLE